eukprot:jgi/Chlat1/8175/Chrsp76S07655
MCSSLLPLVVSSLRSTALLSAVRDREAASTAPTTTQCVSGMGPTALMVWSSLMHRHLSLDKDLKRN